jgi:hypothetical protein
LWVIFALLDPDPATQINADPASYASYAAAARCLQRRHEDVAHEGGERGVGFRRSAAAVMIVMVMTLQQRVGSMEQMELQTLFGRDSAARTFL